VVQRRPANTYGSPGSRFHTKISSQGKSTAKPKTKTTQFGRGVCTVCFESKPLTPEGLIKTHTMYFAPCLGAGLPPRPPK